MSSDPPGSPSSHLSRRSLLLAGLATVTGSLMACAASGEPGGAPSHVRSWGAFLPVVSPGSGGTPTPIDQLAALAGAQPDYLQLYASTRDSLPVDILDSVRRQGVTPMLTLEPWRHQDGPYQPDYSLAALVAGRHDADLSRWAGQLGAWGHHILLRFAQEMNGPWYPWSIGINQNTVGEYRAAWMRMHGIISRKAPNVRFVWAPNAITEGTTDFADCYPGGQYVDYLGLDGYNWGAAPGHSWQSADKLFTGSIAGLERLDRRLPILVTEVGCAEGESVEQKAVWIREFFEVIGQSRRVEGFLWFQMDKERDWRFNSTVGSAEAFRGALREWRRGA